VGSGGPFPGGKARPGLDADHSPPSSAEVVNEQELYLLSASMGILWDCFVPVTFYMFINSLHRFLLMVARVI
jgi:hypothetical protein